MTNWQDIAITLFAVVIMLIVLIAVVRLIEAILGATFSAAAYLVGLLVYGITWSVFILSAIIWVPLSIIVVALVFVAGLIFTLIWPRGRRRWKLGRLAGGFQKGFLAVIVQCLERGDLPRSTSGRHLSVEGLRTLSDDYDAFIDLPSSLENDINHQNAAKILTQYLVSIGRLEQGVYRLQFTSPAWKIPDGEFPFPTEAMTGYNKLESPKDMFRHPIMALVFLCLYPVSILFWSIWFPFSFAPTIFANATILPYRWTVKRLNTRLSDMQSLLGSHRKSIEDTIRSFEMFQSEQKSVHEQTKALRDELAQELAEVREMVTQHRDEVSRVRQYVALVKERSDKMDATDPLKEMKALLSEIKDSRS